MQHSCGNSIESTRGQPHVLSYAKLPDGLPKNIAYRTPLQDVGNRQDLRTSILKLPGKEISQAPHDPIFVIFEDSSVVENDPAATQLTPSESMSAWSPCITPKGNLMKGKAEPEPLEYAALSYLHELPQDFVDKLRDNMEASETRRRSNFQQQRLLRRLNLQQMRALRHLQKENVDLRRRCQKPQQSNACISTATLPPQSPPCARDEAGATSEVSLDCPPVVKLLSEQKLPRQVPTIVLNLCEPRSTSPSAAQQYQTPTSRVEEFRRRRGARSSSPVSSLPRCEGPMSHEILQKLQAQRCSADLLHAKLKELAMEASGFACDVQQTQQELAAAKNENQIVLQKIASLLGKCSNSPS